MRRRVLLGAAALLVVALVALLLVLRRGTGDEPAAPPRAATSPTEPGAAPRAAATPPPALPGDAGVAGARDLPQPVMVAESSPSAFGGHAGITGRVVLETGEPVARYGIVISKGAGRHYADQPVPVTDAAGRFSFEKVVAGTWTLAIAGPGIARHVVPDVQLVDGKVTDVGTIKVHGGLRITGRVLGGDSHGIAGARVGVESSGDMHFEVNGVPLADDSLSQHTTTDADGHYVLTGVVPEGGTWLEASRGDAMPALRHPIPDDDATIDFVFDAAGGIDGQLEGSGGGQVAARMGGEKKQASADRAGKFTFDGLQPGEYVVNVLGGMRTASPPPVRVTVAANQRVSVTIPRPATGVTLVATPCTAPLALFAPDEEPEWHGFDMMGRLAMSPCRAGEAVIEGITPGPYLLCHWANPECMSIVVAAAPARQTVTLNLQPLKTPP